MQAIVSLGAVALFVGQALATNGVNRDVCDCTPSNQAIQSWNGGCYCCPGVIEMMENDNPFCCAGGIVSQPDCFPFCSGSSTSVMAQSCSASIYFTDADYSSKVSPYVTGTGGPNPSLGVNSAATSTSASNSESGADDSGTSGSSGSSSSSEGAAAAMVTSGPLVGALMVAGGLVLAA